MMNGRLGKSVAVVGLLTCAALLCGLAAPALAQGWPVPEVVLEVHPNERGDGVSAVAGNQFIGAAPWSKPVPGPVATYWWQDYVFAASGHLWIQVCAQNWSKAQNGGIDDDNTMLFINGVFPADWDGIQTGVPGASQWRGDLEKAQRWTLRFLVMGKSGKQLLRIGADETPVVWWVKVTDLEPGEIMP